MDMDLDHMHLWGALYKRDSKGKIRYWDMAIVKSEDNPDEYGHCTVSGLRTGKFVISGWKACKGKNIGKSNETTSHTQTIAEIEALYKKKLAKDYVSELEDVDQVKMIKPMLAYGIDKCRDNINYPVFSQPKLDGIRCIARADGLWTRSGKRIISCSHIEDSLERFFKDNPKQILDGELYNHDLRDDFNQITSLVRRENCTSEQQETARELIQYHVYDNLFDIINSSGFADRSAMREANIWFYFKDNDSIKFVKTVFCENENELDEQYGIYLEAGYEGQMIRNRHSPYKHGRSKDLIKRKEFVTEECKVLEIMEGQGNWAGAVKHLRLQHPSGVVFDSGMRGKHDDLTAMWKQQRKPKWATIRRFKKMTPDGMPRFPVAIDWGFEEKRVD